MRTQGRLTDQELVDIVRRYTVDLIPMIQLARDYGVTRQGIYKVLRKAGIDTSKQAANLPVSCSCCGKQFTKKRCQVRKAKHVFCGEDCYFAWLKHGNGNPLIIHRSSARLAHKIVGEHYTLLPGQVVHHEDRNQFNNHISNLKVFSNNGDHVRYHRGFIVPVLFDGSMIR